MPKRWASISHKEVGLLYALPSTTSAGTLNNMGECQVGLFRAVRWLIKPWSLDGVKVRTE